MFGRNKLKYPACCSFYNTRLKWQSQLKAKEIDRSPNVNCKLMLFCVFISSQNKENYVPRSYLHTVRCNMSEKMCRFAHCDQNVCIGSYTTHQWISNCVTLLLDVRAQLPACWQAHSVSRWSHEQSWTEMPSQVTCPSSHMDDSQTPKGMYLCWFCFLFLRPWEGVCQLIIKVRLFTTSDVL